MLRVGVGFVLRQLLYNMGRLYSWRADIYGAPPNVQNVLYTQFTNYNQRSESALDVAEQVYTVAGSQGVTRSPPPPLCEAFNISSNHDPMSTLLVYRLP